MSYFKLLSTTRGIFMSVEECLQRIVGENFRTTEKNFGSILCLLPSNPSVLRLEMEDEPQFKTRIGDCQTDSVTSSKVDRLIQVGVLIHIKNTPDLVEVSTAASSFVTCLTSLSLDSTRYERKGNPSERINLNENVIPITTTPINEIQILCPLPLHECEDFFADSPT